VHAVLGQVLGLDGLEGAGAHMQRDAGAPHTARVQRASKASSKCSAAVGAATAPGLLRKHGLVARSSCAESVC
jgi:hypothetical protein